MNILRDKQRFNQYVSHLNEYIKAYFLSIGAPDDAFRLLPVWGKKYIRLDAVKGTWRETWGFVDIRNGDCLKAASFKSPSEKTPRGNIFDGDFGMSHVIWSGYDSIENGSGWPKGLRLQGVYHRKKKR